LAGIAETDAMSPRQNAAGKIGLNRSTEVRCGLELSATREVVGFRVLCSTAIGGFPLRFISISALILGAMATASTGNAQTPDNPEIAACKATGILALKEKSPSLRDLVFDMDTMVVSKANTEIEGIPIRAVIMGDVYLEKKVTGNAQHFLCLIGEKGKVLLTFFAGP